MTTQAETVQTTDNLMKLLATIYNIFQSQEKKTYFKLYLFSLGRYFKIRYSPHRKQAGYSERK